MLLDWRHGATRVRPDGRGAGAPPVVATRTLGPIAQAAADISTARQAAVERQRSAAARRRCLLAIDRCLERLEAMHEERGGGEAHDLGRGVLADLEATAGMAPPMAVRRARGSYRLHDALLGWQSSVLDALVAERRVRYPDLVREPDRRCLPPRHRERGPTPDASRDEVAVR